MIVIAPLVIIVAIIAFILRPRKTIDKSRKFSILALLIPSFAVAIAAIVFQLIYNASGDEGVANISNTLFITGFGIICAAILALIVLVIMRKWETGKGIGFGICIAVIIDVIVLALLEWLGGV
jgi:hypothetical protein